MRTPLTASLTSSVRGIRVLTCLESILPQKGSYSYADVYDEEQVLSGKLWEMVGQGLTVPVEKFTASMDKTTLTNVHLKYERSKPSGSVWPSRLV